MSLLNNIKTADTIEESKDVVAGSGNFAILESGIYKAKIEVAYAKPSQRGALGITVKFLVEVKNKDEPYRHNETFYVTNAKGENFYTKDGKNYHLPSYNTLNDLTNMLLGKSLNEISTEDKNIPIYDFSKKEEVLEQLPVLTALTGRDVAICLLKIRDNKKAGKDQNFAPTEEEVFYNKIDKFLNKDGFTHLEQKNNQEEPEFATEWAERWKDKTKDLYKEVTGSKKTSTKQSSTLEIG